MPQLFKPSMGSAGVAHPSGKSAGKLHVTVIDPLGAASDPDMPFIAAALDPEQVARHLTPRPAQAGLIRGRSLREIRVTRHKPKRRCLVEYHFAAPGGEATDMTFIGKIQARGVDTKTYGITRDLAKAGFTSDSRDGIAVPLAVAIIPKFRMWLQRKMPGRVVTDCLAGPDGIALMARVAAAAHKLHGSGVVPRRRHGMAEELAILDDRLGKAAAIHPEWQNRLENVRLGCHRLGGSIAIPNGRPIHRDYYPDQLLVDGPRLYLLDLDLFCLGDPALDIGNFIGHLTELALRQFGHAEALLEHETTLIENFAALAGAETRPRVQAYADLTLVRHIYLSTQFAERKPLTGAILDLCETRLGLIRKAVA
jgi:hypothetical protein